MGSKVEFEGDGIRIQVDGGSRVHNVRVNGRTVSIGRPPSRLARTAFWLGLVAFGVGLGLLAAECTAHAQSGSCEFIKDADERHYCRACSGRPGECEFIKRADPHRTRRKVV